MSSLRWFTVKLFAFDRISWYRYSTHDASKNSFFTKPSFPDNLCVSYYQKI